jgi:uncharacterized protein YbbC (DUF1343 family)
VSLILVVTSIDVQKQVSNLLKQLSNKRVAFLTNPTGVDDLLVPLYQRVLDGQKTYNITLVCFFAPEHGLRGDRQAGDGDDDYVDQQTGLPVYSLYGKRLAPTNGQLATIDAIVYDIQDVGSRYYTYIWTLTYTMQALIQYNKTLYVFDRPNPLGSKIEGCVLSIDTGSIGRLLPGQKYSIPVRYGLTAGEFVKYVVRFMGNLTYNIVEMIGYDPDSIDIINGSRWVMSSPNMPTLSTVIVYPGMGIFEGTSISEGRGTTRPF